MKPASILLLTATIFATTVPLQAQVESPTPSPAATAAPVAYEPLPTLKASVILQPQYFQGPNFTVRDPVPTYSGSNRYTIDSDYGVFEADGNQMLMRRVAEINAIAKLQAMSQTKEFTQAAAQAASAPLHVAQDLVTNPVSTISSVPRGIWGFLNQAGEAVKEATEGQQATAAEGNAVENMTGFSKTKRDIAIKARGRSLHYERSLSERVKQGRMAGVSGKIHGGPRDGCGRRRGALCRQLDQHADRCVARQEPD